MVHSTVGTPFYMSPECIQGTYYDWKSDIWSLGCLLYELATLRSPFFTEGLNYYTLGKKINKRAFEPISDSYSLEVTALVACRSSWGMLARARPKLAATPTPPHSPTLRTPPPRARAAASSGRPHDPGRPEQAARQ